MAISNATTSLSALLSSPTEPQSLRLSAWNPTESHKGVCTNIHLYGIVGFPNIFMDAGS